MAKTKLEQRIRIAEYLDKVADCLLPISAKLGEGSYSLISEECASLRRYMLDLPNILKGTIDDDIAEKLNELLLYPAEFQPANNCWFSYNFAPCRSLITGSRFYFSSALPSPILKDTVPFLCEIAYKLHSTGHRHFAHSI